MVSVYTNKVTWDFCNWYSLVLFLGSIKGSCWHVKTHFLKQILANYAYRNLGFVADSYDWWTLSYWRDLTTYLAQKAQPFQPQICFYCLLILTWNMTTWFVHEYCSILFPYIKKITFPLRITAALFLGGSGMSVMTMSCDGRISSLTNL